MITEIFFMAKIFGRHRGQEFSGSWPQPGIMSVVGDLAARRHARRSVADRVGDVLGFHPLPELGSYGVEYLGPVMVG
jgi:hypothetical protein